MEQIYRYKDKIDMIDSLTCPPIKMTKRKNIRNVYNGHNVVKPSKYLKCIKYEGLLLAGQNKKKEAQESLEV
jgi:hypothetical protein